MTILQQQLQLRMEEKRVSPEELEQQAGLKLSSVRNILRGRSKKPSAESLIAIARVLGCSVEELYDLKEKQSGKSFQSSRKYPENLKDIPLFLKTMTEVTHILEQNVNEGTFQNDISLDEIFSTISEIYFYSLKNSTPNVDRKFAEWVIEKNFVG